MAERAAFFDLDKTIIAKASMAAFGPEFIRGGLVTRRAIAKGIYSNFLYSHLGASDKQLQKVRENVLKLTKGIEQAKIKAVVEESLAKILNPIIYQEALDKIEWHQARGDLVFIVSASPEELVAPIGRYLGVDGQIASRAEVDSDGKYTGAMEFYAYKENKALAVKELAQTHDIDLSKSYAYSDSYSDIELLRLVGHPVAVNPDRALLKEARMNSWQIEKFKSPVNLIHEHEKRTYLKPLKISLAAGSIALLLVILKWRLRKRPVFANTTTEK